MPPPVAERPIAMMQVAMLDAVNRKYRLYLCSFRQKPRPPGKPRRQLPALVASVDVPAPTIEVLT
jgi:hypothetical protein